MIWRKLGFIFSEQISKYPSFSHPLCSCLQNMNSKQMGEDWQIGTLLLWLPTTSTQKTCLMPLHRATSVVCRKISYCYLGFALWFYVLSYDLGNATVPG